jgi:hypothetical protein
MPRDGERRIKVSRTIYHEPSDTQETFTWEGDPDIVREHLHDLGLFPRPKTEPLRVEADSDGDPIVRDSSSIGPIPRKLARWRQIADFIKARGPPEYVHSQAMIERHFIHRRLSSGKEPTIFYSWYKPTLKARKIAEEELHGKFERSPIIDDDHSYVFKLVRK